MSTCKSPFEPVPNDYITTTYELVYNINGSVVIPKFTVPKTTSIIQTPALRWQEITKYVTVPVYYPCGWFKTCQTTVTQQIGPKLWKPYVGTGSISLTVFPFQATPNYNLTASGTLKTTITTGTKLEDNGLTNLPTVLTVANLNLQNFVLNLVLSSERDGIFLNNYGFNINIPINISQQFSPSNNGSPQPYYFPALVAQIPKTPLQVITIYDLIGKNWFSDLLISFNMTVEPEITNGTITTTWVYCVSNGKLSLGATATVTLNIQAKAYFKPNPIQGFTVPSSEFTIYKTSITKAFNLPAIDLTIKNTGGVIPGPAIPTPPVPIPPVPTPPVPTPTPPNF